MNNRIPDELRAEILALGRAGRKATDIAAELNVSSGSVYRILHQSLDDDTVIAQTITSEYLNSIQLAYHLGRFVAKLLRKPVHKAMVADVGLSVEEADAIDTSYPDFIERYNWYNKKQEERIRKQMQIDDLERLFELYCTNEDAFVKVSEEQYEYGVDAETYFELLKDKLSYYDMEIVDGEMRIKEGVEFTELDYALNEELDARQNLIDTDCAPTLCWTKGAIEGIINKICKWFADNTSSYDAIERLEEELEGNDMNLLLAYLEQHNKKLYKLFTLDIDADCRSFMTPAEGAAVTMYRKTDDDGNPLYTVGDIAAELGVSVSWVYALLAKRVELDGNRTKTAKMKRNEQMRQEYASGDITQAQLATKYNLSQQQVQKIVAGLKPTGVRLGEHIKKDKAAEIKDLKCEVELLKMEIENLKKMIGDIKNGEKEDEG